MNPALNSSKRMDWGTPEPVRGIVLAFGEYACGVFDPCPGETPVGSPASVTGSYDGLANPWPRDRLTYVNPPYGREAKHWVQKAIVEADSGSEVVMLLASRTDTRWTHDLYHCADAVCFIAGRLTFLGAPWPAPFPSMMAYFGDRTDEFRRRFGKIGYVPEKM